MRAKNRGISVEPNRSTTRCRAYGRTSGALRQVTLKLLSNAIKFTPQRADRSPSKSDGRRLGGQYLSIRDTGPGIPEDEIRWCFLRSARIARPEDADEGTGLGLPIVKGLVDIARRGIQAALEGARGAEVIVIFPPERVMNACPSSIRCARAGARALPGPPLAAQGGGLSRRRPL